MLIGTGDAISGISVDSRFCGLADLFLLRCSSNHRLITWLILSRRSGLRHLLAERAYGARFGQGPLLAVLAMLGARSPARGSARLRCSLGLRSAPWPGSARSGRESRLAFDRTGKRLFPDELELSGSKNADVSKALTRLA